VDVNHLAVEPLIALLTLRFSSTIQQTLHHHHHHHPKPTHTLYNKPNPALPHDQSGESKRPVHPSSSLDGTDGRPERTPATGTAGGGWGVQRMDALALQLEILVLTLGILDQFNPMNY